ncbi:hypothetical protein FJY71_03665 [candidate division WOR-3 bacterium]|nr:hypothetical protein [candidate division WOR-3 bacterium]
MQSIGCDSAGRLHAAWVEGLGTAPKRVVYSVRPAGGRWSVPETIAETTSNHVSLAVEHRSGSAHIAFVHQFADTNDVCYATNRTGAWARARITKDSVYDVAPSIALEQDSFPHVAWVTREPGVAFRIGCATSRSGTWVSQLLRESQLGDFGLGAAPFLAVSPAGRAHVSYRGGNYPDYHVHHAQNAGPGDTSWTYDALTTANNYDYSSALAAFAGEELKLVCSGNDGWGMPFRTHYLRRPAGSNTWNPCTLMTGSASASIEGFCVDGRDVHATWQIISGNVLMEMLHHVTNASGHWLNSAVRADSHTSRGALVVGSDHCGHALVVIETPADTELYCVNSAPLVGVEGPPSGAFHLPGLPAVVRGVLSAALPAGCPDRAGVFAADGRLIRTLPVRDRRLTWDTRDDSGRPVPGGAYTLRCGIRCGRTLILR